MSTSHRPGRRPGQSRADQPLRAVPTPPHPAPRPWRWLAAWGAGLLGLVAAALVATGPLFGPWAIAGIVVGCIAGAACLAAWTPR